MQLAPFGEVNNGHKDLLNGMRTPMYEWPGSREEYADLLNGWLDDVANNIWPSWDGSDWVGGAKDNKEADTKSELEIAVQLYHGPPDKTDILTSVPDVPASPDGKVRNQLWHYRVEDAYKPDRKYKYIELGEGGSPSIEFLGSDQIGANYLMYQPGVDIHAFTKLFWGRMRGLQPALFDIKVHFQRPRPYTAATALGVENFRWHTADGITHTGVHPSILSGHCIQGILAGCSVFEAWLEDSARTGQGLTYGQIKGLQKYMVDWGDRRVFAGVHYMTDNIASWALARLLIPHLFRNSQKVQNFAIQAVVQHSKVFLDIHKKFSADRRAYTMLKKYFPEPPLDWSPDDAEIKSGDA